MNIDLNDLDLTEVRPGVFTLGPAPKQRIAVLVNGLPREHWYDAPRKGRTRTWTDR